MVKFFVSGKPPPDTPDFFVLSQVVAFINGLIGCKQQPTAILVEARSNLYLTTQDHLTNMQSPIVNAPPRRGVPLSKPIIQEFSIASAIFLMRGALLYFLVFGYAKLP